MFDHMWSWFSHSHSDLCFTAFPEVRGLGLDEAVQGTPSPGIHGPAEYIFKIGISPPIKNQEGILVQTGTSSPTFISFKGAKGETGMIPIKASFKEGTVGEFAAVANDVGPIKSIKIAEPFSKKFTWRPTTLEVNRISPSMGKDAPSSPDGWVKFDINRVIKEPVTIVSRGPGSTGPGNSI